MRSIYYLERYMVLTIGFVVCGAVSLFFSLAGSAPAEFPSTAVLFLVAGAAAAGYVLKHRNDPAADAAGTPLFPKVDGRELLIILKASWAVQEISVIVLLFAAFNAGPILALLAGDVSGAVVSAVRILLMGLLVVLALVYLIAHTYFERKV